MKKGGQKTVVLSLKFMNAKLSLLLAVLCALPHLGCWSAPTSYNPSNRSAQFSSYEDPALVARQTRTVIADLKHEVNNHEAELRIFDEKLHNQEMIFENLRQEILDSLQGQKDYTRATSVNLDGRIDSLDNTVKGLINDMRQLKTQANDSVQVLTQYKQKLGEIEKIIEAQNQHMKSLEGALNAIMEVLQAKDAAEKTALAIQKGTDGIKTYKVQPGDTLEKIAKAQKVSVQVLRDYNKLSNDRIVVGQTLKIP